MGEADKFAYVYSCDLDISVKLKIGSLEGKREQKSYKAVLEDPMLKFSGLYQETCSDLYVTCQVFAEGKPLALPVRTSYKAFSTRWKMKSEDLPSFDWCKSQDPYLQKTDCDNHDWRTTKISNSRGLSETTTTSGNIMKDSILGITLDSVQKRRPPTTED